MRMTRTDADRVTLRLAAPADREHAYRWCAQSDITELMLGPPTFPDAPIPTWEEFVEDYRSFFFDGPLTARGRSFVIEADGRPVGHVSFDGRGLPEGTVEVDVWLSERAVCGRGYGPRALRLLVDRVRGEFGTRRFILRPTARNSAAIRAYTRAGFALSDMSQEQAESEFGAGDYHDFVTFIREFAD
jgi:RimJ/RimL family protein N-acetyltransferase